MHSARHISAFGAFGAAKKKKGGGAPKDPCKAGDYWRKRMWKENIFTKKRVEFEKRANAADKACREGRKGGKGGKKGKASANAKTPPAQLWRMDPNKRPIDVWGVIGGNLMGGEDELIAVAKGARTSFKSRPADDRATIRGGLAVLAKQGFTSVNVKRLSSKLLQGKKEDGALIRAAGGKGSGAKALSAAADLVRRKVSSKGEAMEKAAWGARALFLMENMKGMTSARNVGTAIVSVFGPIGMIIGGAMAVHGAISGSVAKNAIAQFTQWTKEGLRDAPSAADDEEKPRSGGGRAPPPGAAPPGAAPGVPSALPSMPAGLTSSPLLWWGLGAAVVVTTLVVTRRE